MKKISFFVLLLSMILSCAQPGSEDDAPTLTDVPDAKVADDNVATGVYKGVLADTNTSGTYMIEIMEEVTSKDRSSRAAAPVYNATIYLNVDGNTITKTGTATSTFGGGINVNFSAEVERKQFILNMFIASDGNVTRGEVIIGGTTIESITVKEKSTQLVEAFQGTFTGNANGVPAPYWIKVSGSWNFIVIGNILNGVYSGKESSNVEAHVPNYVKGSYTGTISESGAITLSFISSSPDFASGQKTGDKVSGVWTDNASGSNPGSAGTWTGSRTR